MNTDPRPTTTTSTVRSSRSLRRGLTALMVLGVLVGAGACGGAAADSASDSDGTTIVSESGPSTGEPTSTTSADAPVSTSSVSARISKSVDARSEPSASSTSVTTLSPTTELGSKTTLLVVGEQDDWVQVLLPVRPNGATGWLRKADVELKGNDMAVAVDLATRKVTVTKAGEVVVEAEAAIGAGKTPTPTGTFSVTDLVETEGSGSAYGPYAIGLSGHSETLSEFGGGDGQIGLHGTNDPSSIGQAVSHGCVRVPNDIVTQIVQLVPLGTPVVIS